MESRKFCNINSLLSLLNAGLWEQSDWHLVFREVSFYVSEIFKVAKEQSVVGVLCAGIEKMGDWDV